MAAISIQVPYPVFYDRDGQPLDNGNIYIGIANLDPVTNPLQVYYDEALTLTASQPLFTSGGYVYRNGTPTQLYVDANDFSITVNDSKGLFVYNFPEATGIGVGAAAISFTGFKGQVGTVADLADADGSDWIGYTPAGTSSVARSAQDKMRDIINIEDYGADATGVADSTSAIQAAVKYCAINGGGSISFPPFGVFKVIGTVLLTENISLDLQGCRLVGNNNIMFETAYLDGSNNIVSNIGTSPETRVVRGLQVRNGIIERASIAFNLFNFINNSIIEGTIFRGCDKAVYADRSFYGTFRRLTAIKWYGDQTASIAYTFINFVNIMTIEACTANTYDLGFLISGGADGQKLLNCAAEGGRIGAQVFSETSTLEFDTFYFESLSECGLDLDTPGSKRITVRNSWFYTMPVGIRGGAGIYANIDESNTIRLTTIPYEVTDVNTDFTTFSLRPSNITGTQMPVDTSIPNSTGRFSYVQPTVYFENSTGGAMAKGINRNDGLVPFEFAGQAGFENGKVPFSVVTKVDNNNIACLTSIVDSPLQQIIFNFEVSDNLGAYNIWGIVGRDGIFRFDANNTKTVVKSTSGGKVVLTIGGLSIPSTAFGCSGLVRHV